MIQIKTVQSHSPTRLSALTVRKWHILLGEKSSHISMKELLPGSTIPVRLQGELGAGVPITYQTNRALCHSYTRGRLVY